MPSPSGRALPPLNALRAFEAFGRRGRMTAAAEELCVTHGAVSRQIRQLEQWLGFALTEGPKTHLRLTPQAEALLAATGAAFDLIGAAAIARTPAGDSELRLGCHGTLAIRWLIPRLGDFAERHPDIRLQLREIQGEPDFTEMADIDAAIQLGGRSSARQIATPFMADWSGPVMSPARWAALGGDEARVLDQTRLHARTWPQAWSSWAKIGRITLAPARAERSFDHFSHALEAAAAGLGVAMAPWAFVADDVTAGRLAAPLGFVKLRARVALARPAGRTSPALDRLGEWLAEQGARMPPPPRARMRARTD